MLPPLPRFTPDAPLAGLLSLLAPLSLPLALSSFAGASLALGIVALSDLGSILEASISTRFLSRRNDERTMMTYLGASRVTDSCKRFGVPRWKRTRAKNRLKTFQRLLGSGARSQPDCTIYIYIFIARKLHHERQKITKHSPVNHLVATITIPRNPAPHPTKHP